MGVRVSCLDFVGRAEELDLLATALESAAAGRAATVLVGGDAGVGKTRLVDELCHRARGRDALTATGVCVPVDGGGLPYGPVVGILRDIAHQLGEATAADILSPLAQGLGSALPGLRDSPASSSQTRVRATDELAKTRLYESILACFTTLATLAERTALVLVFDDLQWADSASAEVLSFLTRNLTDAPVLLVGIYRSDEVGPDHELRSWLAELGRHARVTELRLYGLDRDELTAMIAGILGHQPDWTLVEAVWTRSQGNPFFAEELTAAGPAPSLPPELRRVIMTRVEGLSKKSQQLLRVLAVAGMTAEHRLLAAVADGFDADTLDGALAEAVDSQVVVVDDSRTGYRFRHALVQEAVDASLLPGERTRLHRRLAEAVTADASLVPTEPGHRAAALAVHWWAAGEWAAAYTASVDAADAARALWAFPEAFIHLERALAALERTPAGAQPTPAGWLGLLDRAADVAYLAGAGPRSVELAQAAIDGSDADTDPTGVARRYAMLGRNCWSLGDSDVAFAAYRRAVELMPANAPSPELAQVVAEEARGLMLMARYIEAEGRCRRAITAARVVGARAEEGHALNTLGVCRFALGYFDEGVDLLHQALAIARENGVSDDVDRAYTNLGAVLLDAGRLEEAAALVLDALAPGERLGLGLNGAAGNSATALIRLGRYDDAEALMAQMGDRGIGICASAPQLIQLPIEIRRGRFDRAAVLLADADQHTARLSDVQTRGKFHMLAAELAIEDGRPDDAYEEVERALALAAGTDDESYGPEMCALGVRALADRLDGKQARGRRVDADKFRLLARGLVDEAMRLLAAPAARGGQVAPRAQAFVSLCAAEESRLDQSDPDMWAEAASRWEEASEPFSVAYCRWREAEALLEGRAGRSRADDSLQDAWRVTMRLGTRPLRERIERLAQRARIPLRDEGATDAVATNRSTVGADLGLTPREVEVLGQLAAGKTDREIADALFISKKTASVHVSNLLRKLDVANRVEAGKVGQAHRLD